MDRNESTQDAFTVGPTGVNTDAFLDYLDGTGTSVDLVMGKALDRDYWLKLNSTLTGKIFWRTSNSAAAASLKASTYDGFELDHLKVRGELFAGNLRVGGGEWAYEPIYREHMTEWMPLNLTFRPEVPVLRQGDVMKVRITRFGGFGDFEVGVKDDHQSYVESLYYRTNPMDGVAIIDKYGTINVDPFEEEDDESGTGASTMSFGLLGGVFVGLAGMRSRTRRTAILVFALAFAIPLSGCMGGSKGVSIATADLDPSGAVQTSSRPDEGLLEKGVGGVEGKVRDSVTRARMTGAHVSLTGSRIAGVLTDANGKFAFPSVPEGTYVVRFEKTNYVAVERPIEVHVGQVTILRVNLTLDPAITEVEHIHDAYLEKTQLELWSGTISTVGSNAQLTNLNGASYCVTTIYNCAGAFALPVGKRVPAGTGQIQVELTWPAGGDVPKEVGLEVKTAGNITPTLLVPRGPGDPFRLAFYPNEADSGHAPFSTWGFRTVFHAHRYSTLETESNTYQPLDGDPLQTPVPMNIKVTVFKSVLPFEPKHNDLWGDKTEKTIFNGAAKSYSCIGCDIPQYSLSYYWQPEYNVLIPPETHVLKGKLTWQQSTNGVSIPAESVAWTLKYKAANVAPDEWSSHLQAVTEKTRSTGLLEFEIHPTADETDQYYQRLSNWIFFYDDQFDAANVHGIYTQFQLTLTAVKKVV